MRKPKSSVHLWTQRPFYLLEFHIAASPYLRVALSPFFTLILIAVFSTSSFAQTRRPMVPADILRVANVSDA